MVWKDRIKYSIKLTIASILYFTGVLWLAKKVLLKNKAVVLMYHRVLPEQDRENSFSHDGIIVSERVFEKHMRYLKKAFNVISIDEFNKRIKNNIPFDDQSCLITFDDGWRDNFTTAYPILKKHGLPALIFLPVRYIGSKDMFWQEKMTALLYSAYKNRSDSSLRLLEKYKLGSVADMDGKEAKKRITQYTNERKRSGSEEIESVIADIEQNVGNSSNGIGSEDGFLEWDQVTGMADNGVSYGSHGVSHKILTRLDHDAVSSELKESKFELERRLNTTIASFSYPNGDYNKDTVMLAKESGYELAFSTKYGFVDSSDDRFTIRRVNIHNDVTDRIPLFLSRTLRIF